ncbi:Meiotically up-regulated gene 80 protein 1 [Phlyctema vagabunda]|uniref:Meiotically up-regulated gene 80 protein 1 n=1 Tax=Phlyctema vagabunda TaxID=108571 RepID=A0ABR4PX63_9HELO
MLPGGVCAVLDYEVDQMTDYVAEMAQRIVMPGGTVTGAFRKFVSGLLSSTRLPSTTILLGMNYLARRMNILNASGPWKPDDGQVWRMLTIGLLLGSKFLDDNTFQNRSWTEVSGIPTAELNKLETEWLVAMDWCLYVNLDDSKDFKAWLQSWNEWRDSKNKIRNATLERLAPLASIDTSVQRPRPYSQAYNGYTKSATRERPQSGFMAHDHYPKMYAGQLTPPSAPDSGLNTPEYMTSATGGLPRYNDWMQYQQFSRYMPTVHSHAAYVPPRVNPYHTPYYNQYPNSIWDMNGAGCDCHHCVQPKQSYFMGQGYGQQTVVG